MAQLHDLSRFVGRTVLIVEDGAPTRAHVVAAGAGGISLRVRGEQRFVGLDELRHMELDADETHIADATHRRR